MKYNSRDAMTTKERVHTKWQYFILNDAQRSMNLVNKKPQKYVHSKHVDVFIDYFSLN